MLTIHETSLSWIFTWLLFLEKLTLSNRPNHKGLSFDLILFLTKTVLPSLNVSLVFRFESVISIVFFWPFWSCFWQSSAISDLFVSPGHSGKTPILLLKDIILLSYYGSDWIIINSSNYFLQIRFIFFNPENVAQSLVYTFWQIINNWIVYNWKALFNAQSIATLSTFRTNIVYTIVWYQFNRRSESSYPLFFENSCYFFYWIILKFTNYRKPWENVRKNNKVSVFLFPFFWK